MTPKQKAEELRFKYLSELQDSDLFRAGTYVGHLSKQCVLVAVDEIIKTHSSRDILGVKGYDEKRTIEYWQEVKQESTKL